MSEEVKDPEAVLAELRRAQQDLKDLRKENKDLQAAVDANDSDKWRTRAISAETKLALQAQGIKDADRLMKYVGTDGLDIDDEGKVTGLDERLKVLKTDLPELFDPKRRVGGKADIHSDDSVEITKDPLREAVHRAVSPA